MSHVSERELQPGQVIADRYRLEAPIGRGAMGAVWRAVHVRLESPVAIKFLNASIAGDRDMLERFMREARSAAAVRSSHVVQIFDYGVDGSAPCSFPYIAMELLVGEPLDERLAARGALAAPELDKVFAEVARAVGVAHELGVVHRDIKPANIFIAREGGHEVTKVLDFGIAKLIDRRLDAPAGSGTHTGIILGTPNYMSPEQARGHRRVDHRADLWSLAVLAFECLTGRQPFESNSIGDLVVKICTAQPLVPSEVARVPAAFDAWFLRGVDKDPDVRFRSASEMAEALHALLAAEGLGAESRPRSTPSRLEPSRLDIVQRGASVRDVAPRDGALASARPPSTPRVSGHPDGIPPTTAEPSSEARRASEPLGAAPVSAGRDGSAGATARPLVGGPSEITQPSLTTQAVASEVLSGASPPRRRKLALLAMPVVAIGVAVAASRSRATHDAATAPVAAPSGAALAPTPAAALATVSPAALATVADEPPAVSGAANVDASPSVTPATSPSSSTASSVALRNAAVTNAAVTNAAVTNAAATNAAVATTSAASRRTNPRGAARTPRGAGSAHRPKKAVVHEPSPPEPPTSSVPPPSGDDPYADRL